MSTVPLIPQQGLPASEEEYQQRRQDFQSLIQGEAQKFGGGLPPPTGLKGIPQGTPAPLLKPPGMPKGGKTPIAQEKYTGTPQDYITRMNRAFGMVTSSRMYASASPAKRKQIDDINYQGYVRTNEKIGQKWMPQEQWNRLNNQQRMQAIQKLKVNPGSFVPDVIWKANIENERQKKFWEWVLHPSRPSKWTLFGDPSESAGEKALDDAAMMVAGINKFGVSGLNTLVGHYLIDVGIKANLNLLLGTLNSPDFRTDKLRDKINNMPEMGEHLMDFWTKITDPMTAPFMDKMQYNVAGRFSYMFGQAAAAYYAGRFLGYKYFMPETYLGRIETGAEGARELSGAIGSLSTISEAFKTAGPITQLIWNSTISALDLAAFDLTQDYKIDPKGMLVDMAVGAFFGGVGDFAVRTAMGRVAQSYARFRNVAGKSAAEAAVAKGIELDPEANGKPRPPANDYERAAQDPLVDKLHTVNAEGRNAMSKAMFGKKWSKLEPEQQKEVLNQFTRAATVGMTYWQEFDRQAHQSAFQEQLNRDAQIDEIKKSTYEAVRDSTRDTTGSIIMNDAGNQDAEVSEDAAIRAGIHAIRIPPTETEMRTMAANLSKLGYDRAAMNGLSWDEAQDIAKNKIRSNERGRVDVEGRIVPGAATRYSPEFTQETIRRAMALRPYLENPDDLDVLNYWFAKTQGARRGGIWPKIIHNYERRYPKEYRESREDGVLGTMHMLFETDYLNRFAGKQGPEQAGHLFRSGNYVREEDRIKYNKPRTIWQQDLENQYEDLMEKRRKAAATGPPPKPQAFETQTIRNIPDHMTSDQRKAHIEQKNLDWENAENTAKQAMASWQANPTAINEATAKAALENEQDKFGIAQRALLSEGDRSSLRYNPRTKDVTLYVSPEIMDELKPLLNPHATKLHTINGVSIGDPEGTYRYLKYFPNKYPLSVSILSEFKRAASLSRGKPYMLIDRTLMNPLAGGGGRRGMIQTIREERTHAWQAKYSIGGTARTQLDPNTFTRLDNAMPQALKDYLKDAGYSPLPQDSPVRVIEAAAKLITKKLNKMGMQGHEAEAAKWLADYFVQVGKKYGPQALDNLHTAIGWPRKLQEQYGKLFRTKAPAIPLPASTTGQPASTIPTGGLP